MKQIILISFTLIALSGCNKKTDIEDRLFDNVLVIISDDHSFEVTGCYGNDIIRTPNIDQLATKGVIFDNAYANSPICSASRQSLLTGKYPHATGVNLLFTPFNDRTNITIAEHLRDNGFKTGLFGKTHFNNWIWYPLYENGLPGHGFDQIIENNEYDHFIKNLDLPEISNEITTWDRQDAKTIAYKKNAQMLPQPCFDVYCEGTFLANQAVDFMRDNKDNRFFLWVAFHEPHAPFNFPVEYTGKYDPDEVPLPEGSPEDDRWLPKIFKDLSEEEKRGIIASYYTSVEYMDKNVGIILQGLKESNLDKNTLVIYMSDQGYLLNDHKRFEKHTMWEESIRAPLIISGRDKLLSSYRSDALIEFIDVVPTINEALGVEPLKTVQGKSFLPVLLEKEHEHKNYVFAEFLEDNKAMVASKGWKYIFTTGKKDLDMGYETGYPPPGIYHRLYDLKNDPDETFNLAYHAENQNLVAEYQQEMIRIFSKTHPYAEELPNRFTNIGKLVWFCEPRDVGAQPGGYPFRIFQSDPE